MADFRVLEEDGLFFIQEKIYEEYDSISLFTRRMFRMPINEFRWSLVISKAYYNLDDALNKAMELKLNRDTPKQEPKYHYLTPTDYDVMQAVIDKIEESDFEVGYIDPQFIDKFKPTGSHFLQACSELDKIRKAYGKYYNEFRKWIDEDGWFDGINLPTGAMGLIAQMTNEIPCDFNRDNFKHRPKSLAKKQQLKFSSQFINDCEDTIEEMKNNKQRDK